MEKREKKKYSKTATACKVSIVLYHVEYQAIYNVCHLSFYTLTGHRETVFLSFVFVYNLHVLDSSNTNTTKQYIELANQPLRIMTIILSISFNCWQNKIKMKENCFYWSWSFLSNWELNAKYQRLTQSFNRFYYFFFIFKNETNRRNENRTYPIIIYWNVRWTVRAHSILFQRKYVYCVCRNNKKKNV